MSSGYGVTRVKVEMARRLRKAQTPAELILWQHLRANRLDGLHFRRQHPINGFIADFYCNAANLVVEVDGASHSSRREYDSERDALVRRDGMIILRLTNETVIHNTAAAVEAIRRAAAENRKRSS